MRQPLSFHEEESTMNRYTMAGIAMLALLAASSFDAAAQTEVRVARQYGIGYLQFMVMENRRLIEKHAQALGAGEVRVQWAQFSGGSAMNDALLSGNLDIAGVGVPPMVLLWARTEGERAVRGVAALNSYPMYLNTSNPNVKSIRDFTEKDRIAVPAIKVSAQAIALQMAAAKAFGPANWQKLDAFTVAMSHPDAVTALLSGSGTISAHFTNQPFSAKELKDPRVRTVVNSFEIYGGPATAVVAISTQAFRGAQPRLYAAFFAALEEATRSINEDKPGAADLYLKMSNDKSMTRAELIALLQDPDMTYTVTPNNTLQTAQFMATAGSIKRAPASWRELYFQEAHKLPGS